MFKFCGEAHWHCPLCAAFQKALCQSLSASQEMSIIRSIHPLQLHLFAQGLNSNLSEVDLVTKISLNTAIY